MSPTSVSLRRGIPESGIELPLEGPPREARDVFPDLDPEALSRLDIALQRVTEMVRAMEASAHRTAWGVVARPASGRVDMVVTFDVLPVSTTFTLDDLDLRETGETAVGRDTARHRVPAGEMLVIRELTAQEDDGQPRPVMGRAFGAIHARGLLAVYRVSTPDLALVGDLGDYLVSLAGHLEVTAS